MAVQLIATQKTFRFSAGTHPDKIDEVVNNWLLERAKDGTPAQLGKVSEVEGWVFYVFLYSRKVEIKDDKK
jgi:hypothetical protein